MKNITKLLKTLLLCLALVMMGEITKGANNVVSSMSLSVNYPSSVSYGSTTKMAYTLTLNLTGTGSESTTTLTVSNLPAGATATFSENPITIKGKVPLSVTLTISRTLTSAAGTHTFTITETNGKSCNGTYKVNALPIIFNGSKIYNNTNVVEATQLSVGNIIGNDEVKITGNATLSSSDAGSYTSFLTNALTSSNANYSTTGGSVLFIVNQLTLNFTGSKIYDNKNIVLASQVTASGVLPQDEMILGGNATLTGSDVGTYTSFLTNALTSSNANYSTTGGTLSFNITAPTSISWNGTTSSDWTTSSNWAPPYLPDATIDVTIPATSNKPVINTGKEATCNNLKIEEAAGLTIQSKGALTVSNNLTNNAGLTGLSLFSDVTKENVENGTGSLIVNGSASGFATLTRAMTTSVDHYSHLVTSPLKGQTIKDFLDKNATIQSGTKHDGVDFEDFRGMRDYNSGSNSWNEYFLTSTSGSLGELLPGKGYSIMIRPSQDHNVVFTGTLQSGDITVDGLIADKWNCIGNPYTSAITINSNGDDNTQFLATNITNGNLVESYGIYVWDPVGYSTTEYKAVSKATDPSYTLQQGQAFMVKMATGKTSVSFNRVMQTHNVSLALKSTDNIWPTIQLQATANDVNSATTIAFHEGMTNGLDVTYDAGLLKADSPIDLYTRLVDDYGIPFAIQALPSDQYDQLIIPVGVDYTAGGAVSFSAKTMYLPSSCRPILEDRLTGIVTDLSDKTYTVDLDANTAGTGRFYLHTSYVSTEVDSRENAPQWSAWAVGKHEITINGKINNGAVASLYDLQGRLIATHVMREGIREQFSLPAVNPGIYLLKVRDQQKVQALKVVIGK